MLVISGGQTGVDQIGLVIAKELGYKTAGIAPKGYKTEAGNLPQFLKPFGLIEHNSQEYNPRTEMNVIWANITLIFGDVNSPGSVATRAYCKKHKKHYLENPTVAILKGIVANANKVKVLNIAGNRGSKLTAEEANRIRETLREGLKKHD